MNPGSRRSRTFALALAGLVAALGLTTLTGCGDSSNSTPASQTAPAAASSAAPTDPASKTEVNAHTVKPANLMAQGWHFDHLIHPGQAMSLEQLKVADRERYAQLETALRDHFVNEWHYEGSGVGVVGYTLVPSGGVVNQPGDDLYAVLVRVSIPSGFAFMDARQLKIDTLVQPNQFAADMRDAVVGLLPGDVQKVNLANYGTLEVILTDTQRGFPNDPTPAINSNTEPPTQSNSAPESSTDQHKGAKPEQVKNTGNAKPPVRKAMPTDVPAPTTDEIITQLTDSVADADLYPEADRTDKLDRLGDAVTQLTGHNWLQVRATFQGSGDNVVLSNVRTLAGDAIESWVFSSNGRYRVRVELAEGVGPVLTFTCA